MPLNSLDNIRDKLDGDELDLSLMNLKEVPLREIGNITRAKKLDLSSNQLKTLPPNFGTVLSHLVKLDLSSNKLQALPKSFHNLVNLKHLDLYNNQLTDLPASLHHLKSLRFLDIKNNPLNPELAKVVGPCIDHKDCESAAKKLIAHFNKEKQLAIEEQIQVQKMKEAKAQQEREEAAAQRLQNEKRAAKKERKNENQKLKQQQQTRAEQQRQQQQQQRQKSGGRSAANGNASRTQRKGGQKTAKGGCSLFSLNMLLFLTLLGAAIWCFYIHLEGDYSRAGIEAAIPRLQKNVYKLRNITAEALQPENLKKTGRVVWSSVNATSQQVGGLIQKYAYQSQEYIEQYTGDLTPYTSQVSKYCGIAWNWFKDVLSVIFAYIASLDWQGMWDKTVTFLSLVWAKIQEAWSAFSSNPQVQAAWKAIVQYAQFVFERVQELFLTIIQYLGKNGPVWIETIKETTSSALFNAKQSIEGMFK